MRIHELITALSKFDPDAEVLAHHADEQEFEVSFVTDMQDAFVSLQLSPVPYGPPKS